MAFPIRSLDEISASVRGAIRQYLPGTDASLMQNVLRVIGKVVTLLSHTYELRQQWIFKQLFLTTATSPAIIRLHAAEYRILQKPASAAAGAVTGTAQAHATYPAGVRFVSAGVTYVTTAGFTANAVGQFTASVQAESAGAATNRDAAAELLLADPALYPTLPTVVAVGAGGLGGGADIESIEDLRARGLKRKASPPQGGTLPDYENWALEVPGVVSAWAANFANGIGTVGVWILFDGRPNGIPEAGDLAAVDAYIENLRLVRAGYFTVAPVAKPVDLTIALSPDTSANRTAVTDALTTFFDATLQDTRLRPGLPDDPFTLPLAWISEVISTVPGETGHVLTVPATGPVFQPGELPVLGAISWS
ncbi:putative phage protein [Hoeflea phototrophica DFL-43]|uniref:Putative phage protein n=1 Tax=Hoeflea phototrophica (strain DSM 17068 / NCIMB 14078 / DFL-43) TaxID=411684 RepID=A9D4T7_HOEPD|nr:baseplate J/gp47 family protein [Hoeflea phototrophica]EDQ33958.1 putative phage protein [Hoeflea phototrophica DFL-43]